MRAMVVAALMLAAGQACATRRPHMPQGSFLLQPARSRAQVLRQVLMNGRIAGRYAAVFHTTREAVIRAFEHMRIAHLTRDIVAPVYFIRRGDRIGFRVRRIRKGSLVFVSRDGSPLLVQVCGNPLRNHLRKKTPLAPGPGDLVVPDFEPYETLDPMLGEPTMQVAPEMSISLPLEPNAEGEPGVDLVTAFAEPIWLPMLAPMLVGMSPVVPGIPVDRSVLLALLGMLPAGAGGGSNPPPPVPEPRGYGMAAGCAVICVVLLRSRIRGRSGGSG